MHTTLKSWSATRSGSGLVVKGVDTRTGQRVKLTGIVAIDGGDGTTIAARDRDGNSYSLLR